MKPVFAWDDFSVPDEPHGVFVPQAQVFTPPPATVNGTSGDDFIHVSGDGLTAPPGYHDIAGATSGNDLITPNGGDDIVYAGAGDDHIVFTSDFTAADQVDGQDGNDTVELNGDYHAGVALASNTLTDVETVQLDAGHSYKLDFTNALVPNTMLIDGSALGAGDQLTFVDHDTTTSYQFNIVGGAGDDTVSLNATGVYSHIDLSMGGNDTVISDPVQPPHIYMGGALNAGDDILGGQLELNGDYSAGYSFGTDTLRDILQFTFDPGHSYNITLTAAGTASADELGVTAPSFGAGDALVFNAAAVTSHMLLELGHGTYDITTGSGDDQMTFGSGVTAVVHGMGGNDNVGFDAGFNTSTIFVDGGDGNDTVGFSQDVGQSATLLLSPSLMTSVEKVVLSGFNSDSYFVTVSADFAAPGTTLEIDSDLYDRGDPPGKVVIDASAVTDANLIFTGSISSQETFIGGSGNDVFFYNGATGSYSGGDGDDTFSGFGTALSIDGGAGFDVVGGFGDLVHSPTSSVIVVTGAMMTNVEEMKLGQFDSIDLQFADDVVKAGQTFILDGTQTLSGHGFTFDGSRETDGNFVLLGGQGDDVLTGGKGNDTFDGGAGNDEMFGGLGTNTVVYSDATGGVTVDLNIGGAQNVGGGMGTDIIQDFQNIIGSNFNDVLRGSDGLDNVMEGLGGNDTIDGRGGNDTASYAHATGGVTVDLTISGAQNVGGGAGTDTLISIENLLGSEFADTLKGTSGDNVLDGQDGNDALDLSLGGNDTALGGDGDDTISFGASLTAGDAVDGGDGNDTLVLAGDYSAGLTFTAAMMANVEILKLAGGHSYKLTLSDANVAAGQTLSIDASMLGTSDALVFDGSAETNGSFAVTGGAGNDTLTGGAGNDAFDLSRGGNDTVKGGAGNDTISFGGALTASDIVDGGTGSDTLVLAGDYSSGVVFSAATMVNVETLRLAAGHSYKLTLNDANVAAMQTLTIDASALGVANSLVFDGSAETNASFDIIGGAGNDTLTGGAGNDQFDLSHGGNDTVQGGAGSDTFQFGAALSASDKIDGGAGSDTVVLDGDYSAGLTFAAATMVDVETLKLAGGHSYTLTMSDGNVAAGGTLTIDASKLGGGDVLTFDGSAELDGAYVVKGGKGDDHIIGGGGADKLLGGKGDDVLQGGNGADLLNGGKGHDIFVYAAAGQSTSAGFDTIDGFNAKQDKIDVWFGVTGVDATIGHGSLSLATFDSDLAAAVGAANLAANHAVVFTPDAGGLAGDTFLIIDANGIAGYQAGQDLVIELDHPVKLDHLKVADFI